MADKRATPEAPQEAQKDAQTEAQKDADADRRKKRATPTIDLTATEFAAETAANAAPHESASNPSNAAAENKARQESSHAPWRRLAIAAGVGAGLAVLAIGGLWFGGYVSIGGDNSSNLNAKVAALEKRVNGLQNPDTRNLDALSQRLAKIEATLAKPPAGQGDVGDKLAAADNAMKALGLALTALGHRTDTAAANAADARKAADAAQKAVTDLQTANAALATGAAAVPRADVEALDKRIVALETAVKTTRETLSKNTGNDNAVRLALSAAVLRDAAIAGAPFAGELAAVKLLGGDDKALAPLGAFAAAGVPDKLALARELTARIPALLKVPGATAPGGSFLDKLEANARKLVRVQPINAPQGDDVSAVVARIEFDAANADIGAALADLEKLPGNVRAPASAWIEKAKARQAALEAARRFAADAARRLAPKTGAQ